MGWKRVITSGIVGMVLFVPLAYISFRFLNLGESITSDLITDFPSALTAILGYFGLDINIIDAIAGMLIGLALTFTFPIHWCIMYRPEDIGLIIAVTFPWILCCVIASALFAHSPRGGIHTSLAIGIGYAIILSLAYLIIIAIVPLGSAILDGIYIGLTDLPYLAAVLTAILEGCLVGAVFGAFIGSLKYKPKGPKAKKVKRVKIKAEEEEPTELFPPTIEIESTSTPEQAFCKNCSAKLTSEDLFCKNCGAKKP